MNDTIVAISTTLGKGAISIVRLSGSESIEIVNKIFKGKDLNKVKSHTINYGYIVNNDEIIDEVLVSIMRSPKTYTTEDVVEINCHGGIATTNKVLEIILKNGARLAMPGEFTKRAFINGRIDLIKAESVIDLINSNSELERKISINQLSGKVSNLIKNFRQNLLELLASIEVNIDYPEYEDIEVINNENIKKELKNIKEQLSNIVRESENGKVIKNGINTIIIGKPNVGKSSLLNRLLDEEKAIVTDIKGTTRDIVEGSVNLDGVELNFIDTAGIHDTDDIIEKIGINKSIDKINDADLVLMIFNNNDYFDDEDKKLLDLTKDKNRIIVINKIDLEKKLKYDFNENIVKISALNNDGLDNLKNEIKRLFNLDKLNQDDMKILNNVRQISLAKEALEITKDVEKGLEDNMPVDLIEIDIKRIWSKLGEIIGETYQDELLDQLFSQFCLGK